MYTHLVVSQFLEVMVPQFLEIMIPQFNIVLISTHMQHYIYYLL